METILMDDSVIYKPVFWRLFIYRFFPFYIGWTGAGLVYRLNKHFPVSSFLITATLTIFVATLIMVYFTKKKFDIIIDKDKISGLGIGWGLPRETFLIGDLDFSFRNKQSFNEKISFYNTIHSSSGQKIMVIDFIYGRPITSEIYKMAEKNYLRANSS